ncbi:hypothetical protein F5887DRAFT_912476 [Amanita rubescens]|nr:hypothetical protein F5887DRAFT_912476 [Amanita rubescens]
MGCLCSCLRPTKTPPPATNGTSVSTAKGPSPLTGNVTLPAKKPPPGSTGNRTLPSTAGKLPPATSQKRSPSTGNRPSPSTGDKTLPSTAKQFSPQPPKKLSSQKPQPSTSNGPSPSTPQKPSSSTGNGASPSTSQKNSPSTSQKPSPPAVNKASPSTAKNLSSSIFQEPSLSTGKKASPPTGNETLPSTAKQLSPSPSQKSSLPTGNGTLPSNAIKPPASSWTVNIPSNKTPLPTISDPLHRADDDILSTIKTLYNGAAPINTDVQAIMKKLAARNFVQQIKDRDLLENDQTEILKVMQRGLAENKVLSDDERQHIAKNLHTLLRVFNQLLPNPQLGSGEVEWSSQANKNADMHKGRFLHCEDVRMRVIRSADMRDGGSIQRIRDEFEVWAKLHKQDQGKHIIPFHGFYSLDGLPLALVSPWMNNGNALAYVKNRDRDINYGKLILGIAEGIKILHSMKPPIVHGNLRAKNIYIGDEGQPLITDYGLTKFEGDLTATESCRWCAPEMFQQQASVSTKSDVYNFGMTILELLTHQMPYANIKKTAQVVAKKRESGLPDRPQDERIIERGLDDKMWNILCQCWSKNPSNRIKVDKLVTSFRSLLPSEGNGGLLAENGIVPQSKNNTQPNQERYFHPSRPLARLVSELIANGIIANQKQIDLLLKLLNLPDYDGTISVLKASSGTQLDSYVQLLIEIILRLLQDGTLLRSGISDARQKARRLMFELVSETDGMPRSLSITDIKTDKTAGYAGDDKQGFNHEILLAGRPGVAIARPPRAYSSSTGNI